MLQTRLMPEPQAQRNYPPSRIVHCWETQCVVSQAEGAESNIGDVVEDVAGAAEGIGKVAEDGGEILVYADAVGSGDPEGREVFLSVDGYCLRGERYRSREFRCRYDRDCDRDARRSV